MQLWLFNVWRASPPREFPSFPADSRVGSLAAPFHPSLTATVEVAAPHSSKASPRAGRLPHHLVGLIALAQAEGRREVAGEELDLLDASNNSLVDGLLVCGPRAADLLLLYMASLVSTVRFMKAMEVPRCTPCPKTGMRFVPYSEGLVMVAISYLCLLALLEESLLASLVLRL